MSWGLFFDLLGSVARLTTALDRASSYRDLPQPPNDADEALRALKTPPPKWKTPGAEEPPKPRPKGWQR